MQVAGQRGESLLFLTATGARVSNAYPTCPCLGDSPLKGGLIPDALIIVHAFMRKGFPDRDGDASD